MNSNSSRVVLILCMLVVPLCAAEPVKIIPPPPDKEISAADRAVLETGLSELQDGIDSLQEALKETPALRALIPDVQIYYNAVHYPLKYHEAIDVKKARAML